MILKLVLWPEKSNATWVQNWICHATERPLYKNKRCRWFSDLSGRGTLIQKRLLPRSIVGCPAVITERSWTPSAFVFGKRQFSSCGKRRRRSTHFPVRTTGVRKVWRYLSFAFTNDIIILRSIHSSPTPFYVVSHSRSRSTVSDIGPHDDWRHATFAACSGTDVNH